MKGWVSIKPQIAHPHILTSSASSHNKLVVELCTAMTSSKASNYWQRPRRGGYEEHYLQQGFLYRIRAVRADGIDWEDEPVDMDGGGNDATRIVVDVTDEYNILKISLSENQSFRVEARADITSFLGNKFFILLFQLLRSS